MSKKTFNPKDWQINNLDCHIGNLDNQIKSIVQSIEAVALDLAPSYSDWRDLGFALSDELGESGRAYYHRLSRFYPAYSEAETNKQYDKCLNSHGHGISIKTLFHLAKSAGINISIPPSTRNPHVPNVPSIPNVPSVLPTIPEGVYKNLPPFLQSITAKATSPEDKDLLLLGSLTAISSCLPNICGIYDERTVYPNLFLFVTAQASAGKGRLTLCRKLVDPIHRALREKNHIEYDEYRRQLSLYISTKDKSDKERPQEPPLRALFIPANSSATALFQILNDNNGIGLMFETEGDTLAQTFKSEHGNYSDGFRKAFHHEKISYLRRKDREYVELDTPRLSALLSGTPKQVASLIPNAENGLFSRFIFYYMNILPVWKNVFAGNADQTLDDYFHHLGARFFDFYKSLQYLSQPLRFFFTPSQQDQFNAYFSQMQDQYLCLCGVDYLATVRRLALITFRMAMILSALCLMDSVPVPIAPLTCSDKNFHSALELVKVLILHAAKVYESLPPTEETLAQPNRNQQFFDALPPEFSRQDYLTVAKNLNIPEKTAEKHIAKFAHSGLINHFAHDKYRKPD